MVLFYRSRYGRDSKCSVLTPSFVNLSTWQVDRSAPQFLFFIQFIAVNIMLWREALCIKHEPCHSLMIVYIVRRVDCSFWSIHPSILKFCQHLFDHRIGLSNDFNKVIILWKQANVYQWVVKYSLRWVLPSVWYPGCLWIMKINIWRNKYICCLTNTGNKLFLAGLENKLHLIL